MTNRELQLVVSRTYDYMESVKTLDRKFNPYAMNTIEFLEFLDNASIQELEYFASM